MEKHLILCFQLVGFTAWEDAVRAGSCYVAEMLRKSLGKCGRKWMGAVGLVLWPSRLRVSGHKSIHFVAGLGLALICPTQPWWCVIDFGEVSLPLLPQLYCIVKGCRKVSDLLIGKTFVSGTDKTFWRIIISDTTYYLGNWWRRVLCFIYKDPQIFKLLLYAPCATSRSIKILHSSSPELNPMMARYLVLYWSLCLINEEAFFSHKLFHKEWISTLT